MQKIIFLFTGLFTATLLYAQYAQIPEGKWQAVLQRPDGIYIPFTFELALVNGSPAVYIINAEEKLLIDDISFQGDSLVASLPFFDAKFVAAPVGYGYVAGSYYKTSGATTTRIPFEARINKNRFEQGQKAAYNINGKWEVYLKEDRVDIGIFNQDERGNITGTILTPTGDYRYMEGVVNGDSLMVSVFDGGFNMLLTAKIKDDNTLINGMLYSGLTGKQNWHAKRNDALEMNDGEDLTKMRPGEERLNFSFLSTEGKQVSINDERYKGKVVLIQIMGSWCPNCMDETAFLSDYYNKNKHRGLEVIGLAYERTTDFEKNKKLLKPYIERFNVQYPILIPPVAVSDPDKELKTLPQIDQIKAYPSLIYIGRDGKVRKIHSGFSGPASGVFYETYKKNFYEDLDKLLAEK